jgi:GxxExxY protein
MENKPSLCLSVFALCYFYTNAISLLNERKAAKAQRMENKISHKIIGAAIEVHRVLGGPGLLEGIYESCLCHELALMGLRVQRQLAVPVNYKGSIVRDPLYIDILVEGLVIIEVKALEKLHPIHNVQLLTYLRLTGCKLGLLVNFGQEYVKDGTRRVVNGLQEAFFVP